MLQKIKRGLLNGLETVLDKIHELEVHVWNNKETYLLLLIVYLLTILADGIYARFDALEKD